MRRPSKPGRPRRETPPEHRHAGAPVRRHVSHGTGGPQLAHALWRVLHQRPFLSLVLFRIRPALRNRFGIRPAHRGGKMLERTFAHAVFGRSGIAGVLVPLSAFRKLGHPVRHIRHRIRCRSLARNSVLDIFQPLPSKPRISRHRRLGMREDSVLAQHVRGPTLLVVSGPHYRRHRGERERNHHLDPRNGALVHGRVPLRPARKNREVIGDHKQRRIRNGLLSIHRPSLAGHSRGVPSVQT